MSCDRERFIGVLSNISVWFGVSKTNEILCRVAGDKTKGKVTITFGSKPVNSEALGAFIDLLNAIQGLKSFLNGEAKEPQKVQGSDKQPSRPPIATDTLKKLEAQLKASREESEKFRLQCEQLKTDRNDLLKQNETEKKRIFEENEEIIQKWKSKVAELELQCQQLGKVSENHNVEARPNDENAQQEEINTNRDKERDKALGEGDQLQNQLTALRKEKDQVDKNLGELNKKNDELQKEFEKLRAEKDQLEQKLEKVRTELGEKNDQLKTAQLKDKTEPAAESKEPRDDFRADRDKAEAECRELREENSRLKTKIESSEAEIRKVTEALNKITEEASSKDFTKEELKNKEKEIKKLEEKLRGSVASNGNLKRANEDLQKRIGRKQETKLDLVDQLTAKIGSHMTKEQVVKQLMEKNAENIDRLAAEMNAKLASNESALENISILCRPMNIAEEYNLLCSNAWLDAKQALDDLDLNEEGACVFLTGVLQIALEEATDLFDGILERIQNSLNMDKTEGTRGKKSADGLNLPVGIINQVGDYLRNTATTIDITSMIKNVKDKVKLEYQKPKEVLTYISESSRLAWKMVIQRPPMSFDDRGVGKPWEGDTVSDLFWGSDPNAKGAVVRYYVNLILKHGEKPMVKGKVMVK